MIEVNEKGRPDFKISRDTWMLVERLKDCPIGSKVSYDELSEYMGRQISGVTPALRSARAMLMRDHDSVWDCDPGKGLVRLDNDEIVDTNLDPFRRRLHNLAKKSAKRMAVVDIDKVTDKPAYYVALSYTGVILQVTTTKARNRITQAVDVARPAEIPLGTCLEVLKNQ